MKNLSLRIKGCGFFTILHLLVLNAKESHRFLRFYLDSQSQANRALEQVDLRFWLAIKAGGQIQWIQYWIDIWWNGRFLRSSSCSLYRSWPERFLIECTGTWSFRRSRRCCNCRKSKNSWMLRSTSCSVSCRFQACNSWIYCLCKSRSKRLRVAQSRRCPVRLRLFLLARIPLRIGSRF